MEGLFYSVSDALVAFVGTNAGPASAGTEQLRAVIVQAEVEVPWEQLSFPTQLQKPIEKESEPRTDFDSEQLSVSSTIAQGAAGASAHIWPAMRCVAADASTIPACGLLDQLYGV